jgi:hypothetical protein
MQYNLYFKYRDLNAGILGKVLTGGAMKNDFIEGDEWDAYVALDTFSTNGTRDGLTGASPRVTESP